MKKPYEPRYPAPPEYRYHGVDASNWPGIFLLIAMFGWVLMAGVAIISLVRVML